MSIMITSKKQMNTNIQQFRTNTVQKKTLNKI